MQLDRLLSDATGLPAEWSRNARQTALSVMLNQRHAPAVISPKGVAKWFERGTIPGRWLIRIAVLTNPPLNLSQYS